MIYFPLSSALRSREFPQAAGAILSADGQALVSTIVAGVPGVGPSAGTSGEKFVGFLTTQTSASSFVPSTTTKVESITVPVGGVFTLQQTPVSSTTLVYNTTTGAVLTPSSISGKTVTLGASTWDGHALLVTYRHTLSVVQARALVGDATPGGYAGNTVGSLTSAIAGTVYTDQFDSSKDFRAATSLKTAANGLVTDQTGTGATISGVVVGIPSVEFPYLGIEFDAF